MNKRSYKLETMMCLFVERKQAVLFIYLATKLNGSVECGAG